MLPRRKLGYFSEPNPNSFSVLSAHFASGAAREPIRIAYSGAMLTAKAIAIDTADARTARR